VQAFLVPPLQSGDLLQPEQSGFGLTSTLTGSESSVDFTLPAKAIALLAVAGNGTSYPRQLHVGTAGDPLAPEGWLFQSVNLAPLPSLISRGGLVIGSPDGGATINARWDGFGGVLHSSLFALLASHPGQSATPLNLEAGDRFSAGASRVLVNGTVSNNWDGVDVALGTPARVGVAYRQDGIFQPHRASNIPLAGPNAYRIPLAMPYGAPLYNSALEAGVFVWKDELTGYWKLRFTSGGGNIRYTGTIDSSLPFAGAQGVGLEAGDIVNSTNPLQVLFDLQAAGAGEDGITLSAPVGAALSLNLISPAPGAAALVRIGADRWPLSSLPVDLSGW
jgi:hypothetical protein